MRTARVVFSLLLITLKRRLSYRGDLFVQSLDEIMRGFMSLAMVLIAMSLTPEFAGWTKADLLFILGFSMVPIALFHTVAANLYQFSSVYLIEGNFDRVLLRPMPSFLQVCCDGIAIENLSGAVMGSVIMVLAIQQGAAVGFSVGSLMLLLVMLLAATGIVLAIFQFFAALSFWFDDRVGLVPPVYNLMQFGRWPTQIFHPILQVIITSALPFAFTAFMPASLFVGNQQSVLPWLTPAIAGLALVCSNALWLLGSRRYSSTGH